MVSSAMSWARGRGLCRTNEVHGKEEFRVPTASVYSFTETMGTSSEVSGNFELQDENGDLLRTDLSADDALRPVVERNICPHMCTIPLGHANS